MIDSMLTQVKVVVDLKAKYERQKFDTTKKQMNKEVAALEAEWKMFANKKAKLDEKSDETANSDLLQAGLARGEFRDRLVTDHSRDYRAFRRRYRANGHSVLFNRGAY